MRTRREALSLIGALPLIAGAARGQEEQEYSLRGDDGAAIRNFRIPAELDPANLPGIVWSGPKSADVVLYEFFDYNCGFCRKAARDLGEILGDDKNLRLGLINNAILSIGSVQAAKVQQAVLRLHGPRVASEFDARMFGRRGQSDGASALAVVRDMGLDPKKVEESGDSPAVTAVLTRQAKLAASLGMEMTPSFAIAGVGLLGWPGKIALQGIVANARKCDHPLCGA
ncbi:MAG TPA: DsbA family protein [Methylocystis sp.]